MQLDLLPLLQVQRDLYNIPRGWERFKQYLATMTGGTDDIVLPLTGMNPMGKEHVPALIDTLLAFDAEGVATAAMSEAAQRLAAIPGQLRVALVVTDDLHGGWTNRYFVEMQHRFNGQNLLVRGWSVVNIWTSEAWSPVMVQSEVLATIYRSAYTLCFGQPKTLQEMLRQEGLVALFAGSELPILDAEELAYSRDIIRSHLDASKFPILFAALYGDEAAASVGYPPLGLSPRAGYVVAAEDARQMRITPESIPFDGRSICPS